MAKQRYVVVPGIQFVAGASVPLDRNVNLTPEEARFDLNLGRIYLDGTQPPVVLPTDPVLGTDIVVMTRAGLTQLATAAQFASFVGGGAGGGAPTITLSKTVFASGTAKDAILAAIGLPPGWSVVAETTFGGRVVVVGSNLVAAQALTSDASGTLRLRATNAAGTEAFLKTFDVSVAGTVVVPLPTISGAPGVATIGQPYSFTPEASGGSGTRTFALTGALPAGLAFSATTGAITGTPRAGGTFNGLAVTVSDGTGSATLNFALTVQAPAGSQFVTTNNGSEFVTSGGETVYAKAA